MYKRQIKQGCKYFASLLSSCKNQGIDDLNVAIQSDNYGGGYVGYVARKGKKHTFNLAESFAREKSGGKKVTDVYKRQPLVPKGHDFLQTIGRLAQERQVMPEQQGKEN